MPKGLGTYGKKRGRPKEGKLYALTGGTDDPSISRGDNWEDSEVDMTKIKNLEKKHKENIKKYPFLYDEKYIEKQRQKEIEDWKKSRYNPKNMKKIKAPTKKFRR
tara:strand:+ start:2631 stop:2945 length:315 start_codon:yes stop_codon:yes gene_type:complete